MLVDEGRSYYLVWYESALLGTGMPMVVGVRGRFGQAAGEERANEARDGGYVAVLTKGGEGRNSRDGRTS